LKLLAGLIGGIVAALVLYLVYRGAPQGTVFPQDEIALLETRSPTPLSAAEDAPEAQVAEPSPGQRALAVQGELEGASESFRNSTLLIAIRSGGYVCRELTRAEQSGGQLSGWRVACRDTLAYFVAVDPTGALVAEPIPYADVTPFGFGPPPDFVPPLDNNR
jgi:hypothetical protein